MLQKLASFVHLSTTEALDRLHRDEAGQTMAEYGVVLALITLAVVGSMTLLSGNISNAFSSIAGFLP
jgi:Flp pilus assembly pilin Flp